MDIELHTAVFEALEGLDPDHNLPRSELRRITEEIVDENKVTDGEWQFQRIQQSKKEFMRKRNIAHIRGYAPFSSLNQRVYNKLLETFGEEILEVMKKYLADPEDIYSKWSYRFAHTVQDIGLEECKKHKEQIYTFVTSHKIWHENIAKCSESYKDWISGDQANKEKAVCKDSSSVEKISPITNEEQTAAVDQKTETNSEPEPQIEANLEKQA